MTRLHINAQRRTLLRFLLDADRPLPSHVIAQKLGVDGQGIRRSLARFVEHGWLHAEGEQVPRYTVVPQARQKINEALRGWS